MVETVSIRQENNAPRPFLLFIAYGVHAMIFRLLHITFANGHDFGGDVRSSLERSWSAPFKFPIWLTHVARLRISKPIRAGS